MIEHPDYFSQALELLTPELREKVESGEFQIIEPRFWLQEHKPVVKTLRGRLVKGSGRMMGVKAAEEASRESAPRRRKGYRYLTEEFIPPSDLRDSPNAIISFKELIESLIDACNGSPQQVRCKSCGDEFQHAFKKDAGVLYKLFENLNGKAKETQEINVSSQHMSMVLNERTPVREIQVRTLDPLEIETRKKMVIDHDQ